MEWPHEDYPISTEPPPLNLNEEDFLELHRIFTLEKFIPFTKVLLQCGFDSVILMHRH